MQAEQNLSTSLTVRNRNASQFLQDLFEKSHTPSLDSIARCLLNSAAEQMRAHDLDAAMFWQKGYLCVRTILRPEDDLTAFLAGLRR